MPVVDFESFRTLCASYPITSIESKEDLHVHDFLLRREVK
jgi:hypothetical protein